MQNYTQFLISLKSTVNFFTSSAWLAHCTKSVWYEIHAVNTNIICDKLFREDTCLHTSIRKSDTSCFLHRLVSNFVSSVSAISVCCFFMYGLHSVSWSRWVYRNYVRRLAAHWRAIFTITVGTYIKVLVRELGILLLHVPINTSSSFNITVTRIFLRCILSVWFMCWNSVVTNM